jgi:hypothetical protein
MAELGVTEGAAPPIEKLNLIPRWGSGPSIPAGSDCPHDDSSDESFEDPERQHRSVDRTVLARYLVQELRMSRQVVRGRGPNCTAIVRNTLQSNNIRQFIGCPPYSIHGTLRDFESRSRRDDIVATLRDGIFSWHRARSGTQSSEIDRPRRAGQQRVVALPCSEALWRTGRTSNGTPC